MYSEIMKFYGLKQDFNRAEYFMAEDYERAFDNLKAAIRSGGIIALTGMVGSGKTSLLRRIQQNLRDEKKIIVSKSLSTDKRRVNVNTLYTALFSDLVTDKEFRIPTQPEKRERELQNIIRSLKKPVVLFIDEAHELHHRTLTGLKRLVETVEDGGGTLAVVIVGHPALGNELKKPTMEEVGARSKIFHLDGLGNSKRQFIEWVLDNCQEEKARVQDIFTIEAIDLFAQSLVTPLQIAHYMTRALEKGFQVGEKPIGVDLVKSILSPDLDSLEPKLTRQGYNLAVLCEVLNARRSDVKSWLRGELPAAKAEAFNKEIHKAGVF
ncbi:MAG: AAA family ATPase [Legionellales bacterium]|nr:AAA family ATPase [Legionellales bacterium]